jgi:hypothetical protein
MKEGVAEKILDQVVKLMFAKGWRVFTRFKDVNDITFTSLDVILEGFTKRGKGHVISLVSGGLVGAIRDTSDHESDQHRDEAQHKVSGASRLGEKVDHNIDSDTVFQILNDPKEKFKVVPLETRNAEHV